MNTDLMLRARAIANDAEQRGFTKTAEAMRSVLKEMLETDTPKGALKSTPISNMVCIHS